MKFLRGSLLVLVSVLALSIVTIAGIAVITFNTDGKGFPGAEWFVGLGFGAMWVAIACPMLIVLLAVMAWIKSRTE